DFLDLILAQTNLGQVAESEKVHRMATGAHLPVNLIAALQGAAIESAEDAVERPVMLDKARSFRCLQRTGRTECQSTGGGERENEFTHQAFSIDLACGVPPPPLSTGELMLSGKGRG